MVRPGTDAAPTFGELAVRNGLLSREQFEELRKQQEAATQRGQRAPILEELAKEAGYLGDREIHAIKTAMQRMRKDTQRRTTLSVPGYEIVGKLGEGGLGVVYKAKQVSMNRLVALKVLHPQWAEDEEFRKRFLIEARVVGRLTHNNLIAVYDVGKEGVHYYFSMEFVEGQSVEDRIETSGAMTVEESIDILIQITRALQYISRMNLVHRDIKPGNIMVAPNGTAKLGDFGFVKSRADIDKSLSQEGMVLGTPDYIAPEQAMGHDVDFRADLYSLGATLYHMVTGEPPFEGSSSVVMEKHIKAHIRSPQDIDPELPDSIVQIIERMMAKRPEDRYAEYPDLFHDLELAKAGQAPSTERLEVGKSTIYRALKVERKKLDQAAKKRTALEDRLDRLQMMVMALAVAAGVLVVVVVVLVILLAA
jgi:serine/threonine-protein kinase